MLNANKINYFEIAEFNWNYFVAPKIPTRQAKEYCLFGAPMPGRNFSAGDYRYGMNGQEKDNEIFQGAYTAEYWEYDSRIGRRWNLDPMGYAWQSDYSTFNNNPIKYADPSGLKGEDVIEKSWDTKSNSYVETNRVTENSGTDTYIFRGGALDNQRLDYNIGSGTSTWSGGNNSSGLSYGEVMSGAMNRANAPSSINQANTSLCGMTTLAQALAAKDKRGFIELTSTLYNMDLGYNGGYSESGTSPSDWVILSGLKKLSSPLYGNGYTTDPNGGEGFLGMTTPNEIAKIASMLGFKTTENSLSVLPGVGSVDKFFGNLNKQAANGNTIILLVNSGVINGKSQSSVPTHYLIYKAESYKAFADGCFQFDAQTWGKDKYQFGPVNKTRADLKGLFGALIIK
jgi:RHS repeat-associated protein